MWCVPNILVLVLALVVLAILVGLAQWAVKQFPVDPLILKIAYVVIVVAIVLWILSAFCLFDNLGAVHNRVR